MTNFPVDLPEEYRQKAAELKIDPQDIEENFIHGSGSGGQKINKTASCVQLLYQPGKGGRSAATTTTQLYKKIEIKCQKHREREKNRLSAYKLLIRKVETIIKGKQSEEMQKIFKIRKQKQRRHKRAQEKVLELKKQRGELKESRKKIVP